MLRLTYGINLREELVVRKMLELNSAAGTGGRTDAATGTDRLDHLGNLFAATQGVLDDGAERTGLETFITAHTGIDIDLSDGRIGFEHVLGKERQHFARSRASLCHRCRDVFQALARSGEKNARCIRLNGSQFWDDFQRRTRMYRRKYGASPPSVALHRPR